MKNLKDWIITLMMLIFVCGAIYGMYWLFKTVSYEVFYESMVEQTVKELVKPEYLKGK